METNLTKSGEMNRQFTKGEFYDQKMPTEAPLHPWEWATTPWQRIHIDYAGPFQNSMFLVVVDAHSMRPEVIPVSSTT